MQFIKAVDTNLGRNVPGGKVLLIGLIPVRLT